MTINDWKPVFDFQMLTLTQRSMERIAQSERVAKEALEQRIYGDEIKFAPRRAYRRPPGDESLDWPEAARLDRARAAEAARIRRVTSKVKSRVGLPNNAWAFDLRKLPGKLDSTAKAILRNSELFLCRFPLAVVEAKNETVQNVRLTLRHPTGINFRLWPAKTYVSTGSAGASVGGSIKLGLTPSLDLVDLGAEASAKVLWKGEWRWAKASVKASGAGSRTAEWELERDRSAPFAGDSEFHMVLQMPKEKSPESVSATIAADVSPGGIGGLFFEYTIGDESANVPFFLA